MQPIKITIEGDYLDCQIYRSRLYLWTMDGLLKVYNWSSLINSLPNYQNDFVALKLAFLDGNFLYKNELTEIFLDSEFQNLLKYKFQLLNDREYNLTVNDVDQHLFGKQDTPGNILPTDTEIFGNNLYYITEEGLFSCSAHRDKGLKPVSTKPNKLWDCNLLSLKANKFPQLALSGGDEGLYELGINSKFSTKEIIKDGPKRISSKHSSFANYSYLSIYNSSFVDSSFMALFKWFEKKNNGVERELETSISENKIFDNESIVKHLSWGVDDKIYRATDNGFEIARFNNYADTKKGEKYFTPIQNITLQQWKGDVIGGGTAYFGTIVECENALVIIQSDGEVKTIAGPITKWRVYPRSRNFENHLHVILDDRIEIYSFNHDYFLNQHEKIFGIEHKDESKYRWQRK